MNQKTTPVDENISRRDFLGIIWKGLGGLTLLEFGGVFLAYLQPRLVDGEFGGILTVGAVDDFPPGSMTHITNGRFYLARLDDGGFMALYHRCTHLGCTVPWNQAANQFICPCHNSQFDTQGDVLNPPAPRPLDLFPVAIVDGQVLVDTGNSITREGFDPSQVVYA